MKYFWLALWILAGLISASIAIYIVGWRNGTDGWEGAVPVFVLFLFVGVLHFRRSKHE